VATGVGNREIAEGLGISVNTVKYHVANLLRKHGARTRAELAAFSSRA
jgi:DNA-binding NarL/FixJ family response regulator